MLKLSLLLMIPLMLSSAEPDKKLHESSLYPTVKISYEKRVCDCNDCKNKPGQAVASGFIVKSIPITDGKLAGSFLNCVVTAAHNVENVTTTISLHVGKYENWSTLVGFEKYEALVYAVNKRMDLAVLVFKSERRLPCCQLDLSESPFFGTQVFKIGYGLGDDIRIDFGNVTSVETKQPEKLRGFLRSNCYTIFGDSGGPLFYRDGYRVVGVTSSIRGSENLFLNSQSYFTPVKWLKNWDEESKGFIGFIYKDEQKPPQTLIFQLWMRDFEVEGKRK